ncbi:hypothetical protein [Halorubrum tibetense]
MERRKFVIGMGALASGAAAAMGTGAFSAAQINDRDVDIAVNADDSALIQLHPGEYGERVFYEDGQLEISFDGDGGSGINPNSVYQVGAIGGEAKGAFEDFAAGGAEILTMDDVLYGGEGEDGSDTTTPDDPAFEIVNEDSQAHNIELFYSGSAPDTNNAELALVAAGDSTGAFVVPVTGTEQDADRLGAFPLGSGETLAVSLIVKAADFDPTKEDNEFDGELVLNAGDQIVDQDDFDVTGPVDD